MISDKKVMAEDQCLAEIQNGESAYGLVLEHAPHLDKKFKRLCTSMKAFLEEARETFPDARYYTAGGGFNLMLGDSHREGGRSQQELCALNGSGVRISDGDF